jgi:CheY-like chemotaxis protein
MDQNSTISFKTFHDLMPHRIKEILIVASPYDSFIMEEDGGLMEHVFTSYRGVSLVDPPKFTMVNRHAEAFRIVARKKFDLVITMPQSLGLDAITLGKEIKKRDPNLPVIILAHTIHGLSQYAEKIPKNSIDKIFIWGGDRKILWAIVKWLEDRMNVYHDTQSAMVRVLLVVEDSPYYYSSILPILYESIVGQTQAILDDSLNEEHRLLKLRARTKILMAGSYEKAVELYEKFKPFIIGVFSDIRYPRNGVPDPEAGISFLKRVKSELPKLPTLLLSSEVNNRHKAEQIHSHFRDKNSPSLHREIRQFLLQYLGFGDFVFRMPNGDEVTTVSNLQAMERAVGMIPDESLLYHSDNNHFVNWLMARSEVNLASKFMVTESADFENVDQMRQHLLKTMSTKRVAQQQGVVAFFKQHSFDGEAEFLKIGDGSLGGKARGLAFLSKMLKKNNAFFQQYPNVDVNIPKSLVLTTDCYNHFINNNNLQDFTEFAFSDEGIADLFLDATLPTYLEDDLHTYLEWVKYPLAVRSSSLLEDGQFRPYAGLYKTYMLPNNHPDINERLAQLCVAVKLIYASVFYEGPRAFSRTTLHRTEEEKMAVVIQQLTGQEHDDHFYPAISGTAQSHNFYPIQYMNSKEGIAHIAIGLGKIVVDGGQALRFSPRYPQLLPQFSSVESSLKSAQQYFYSLRMKDESRQLWVDDERNLVRRDICECTNEAPIRQLVSSYMPEDHRIRDVYNPKGNPVVTMAPILKHNLIPVHEIVDHLLKIGKEGMGCDVEIEFAINLSQQEGEPHQFEVLQVRPLTTENKNIGITITDEDLSNPAAYSSNALGRSNSEDIYDIIFVKPEAFATNLTRKIAKEVGKFNAKMVKEDRKYLLIGPGRWGSSDSLLGIPVSWQHISGVGGLVETTTKDFRADPSEGTHFFQNITSLGVIYLTIYKSKDFLDLEWFQDQKVIQDGQFLCHVRTTQPLIIKIDGKKNHGVVLRH